MFTSTNFHPPSSFDSNSHFYSLRSTDFYRIKITNQFEIREWITLWWIIVILSNESELFWANERNYSSKSVVTKKFIMKMKENSFCIKIPIFRIFKLSNFRNKSCPILIYNDFLIPSSSFVIKKLNKYHSNLLLKIEENNLDAITYITIW